MMVCDVAGSDSVSAMRIVFFLMLMVVKDDGLLYRGIVFAKIRLYPVITKQKRIKHIESPSTMIYKWDRTIVIKGRVPSPATFLCLTNANKSWKN